MHLTFEEIIEIIIVKNKTKCVLALTLCAHITELAHTLCAYIAVLAHTLCTHIKVFTKQLSMKKF